MIKIKNVCSALLLSTLALSAGAEQVKYKTPQEIFANSKSRVNDIPENWVTENQLINNVCFNLKYALNSKEADKFLDDLYTTISDMNFDLEVNVYRTLYPVKLDYCVMLTFENWNAYMKYETSEEFLSFYYEHWKDAVIKTEEQRIILDTRASKKAK